MMTRITSRDGLLRRWGGGLTLVALISVGPGAEPAWGQPVEFGGDTAEPDESQPAEELDARDVVLFASRRLQSIQEAPMIVTVITRDQIRMGGYRTIEEVLQTIPGFEISSYQGHRLTVVTNRGQSRSYLFLVNGIPHYSTVYNVPNDLERHFDIQMVEKIEVISGPGGVPWGANALLGVVNVITRSAPIDGAIQEFTVGGGDGPGERAVLRAFAETSSQLGTFGRFNLMARYMQTNGADVTVEDGAFINTGPFIWDSNGTFFGNSGTASAVDTSRYFSAMSTINMGDFTLFAHVPYAVQYHPFGPGGSMISGDQPLIVDDDMVDTRFDPLVYLRFNHRGLEDRLGIQATAFIAAYNYELEPFRIWSATPEVPAVPPLGVSSNLINRMRRMGVSIELDAQLTRNNILNYGAEFYQNWGHILNYDVTPIPAAVEDGVPPTARNVFSGFLQDEWRIVRPLALNAGVRYTGSDTYSAVVTSSAAAVWNITGRLYARAAFGEGFRPASHEAAYFRRTNSPSSFTGNPNLEPETSRSVEGELNLVTLEHVGPIRQLYLRLDYSYTTLSDIIKAVGGNYVNYGNQKVHSAEFLGRLDLEDRTSLSLAYYYVRAVDSIAGPVRGPANHIFNASLDYRLLPWLAVTSVFTAVGAREDLNRVSDLTNDQALMNSSYFERLDPYFLLRAGMVVHDLPVSGLRNFELRVFGNNILDSPHPDSETDGGNRVGSDKLATRSNPGPGWLVFADLTYRIESTPTAPAAPAPADPAGER